MQANIIILQKEQYCELFRTVNLCASLFCATFIGSCACLSVCLYMSPGRHSLTHRPPAATKRHCHSPAPWRSKCSCLHQPPSPCAAGARRCRGWAGNRTGWYGWQSCWPGPPAGRVLPSTRAHYAWCLSAARRRSDQTSWWGWCGWRSSWEQRSCRAAPPLAAQGLALPSPLQKRRSKTMYELSVKRKYT